MASGYLHHSAARVARNGGAVFLMAFALTVSAQAVADDAQWQTEPSFYLAGVTGYVEKDGTSYGFDALAMAAELKISHFARRWYASVFAEYHISGDDGFDDIINVGTYWKYNRQSWDATTFIFVNQTPRTAHTWYYASRLRLHVAGNHKVGVEVAGSLTHAESPTLALGYYGDINDSLSVNVIADPGINGRHDFAARMELVWQVH
jgi:hypothetical protein